MKYSFRLLIIFTTLLSGSCETDDRDPTDPQNDRAVFILIDEESIDNGNEPNDFSAQDVNDPQAAVGLRTPLLFF